MQIYVFGYEAKVTEPGHESSELFTNESIPLCLGLFKMNESISNQLYFIWHTKLHYRAIKS